MITLRKIHPTNKVKFIGTGLLLLFFLIILLINSSSDCFAKIWEIKQLTDNNSYDGWVNMEGNEIAWRGIGVNGYIAILYMDLTRQEELNLTINKMYGDFGYPSVSNGQVSFRRISKNSEIDSIILWDGHDLIIIDEYDRGPFGKYGYPPSYSSIDPVIHDGQITYSKWDGNDYEVFLWNGVELIQITDNEVDDYEPQLHNGQISWTGWENDLNKEDVFYWDGVNSYNITERLGVDEDSSLKNGKVVHSGVVDLNYNTDIFLWDGTNDYCLINIEGFDFEPQIGENLISWMGWPDGMNNPAVCRIWDGYKLFNIDRTPSYIYDPHPGNKGIVFVSNDGQDPEIYLATYITGVFKYEYGGEAIDILVEDQLVYALIKNLGLIILDAANPEIPYELARLSFGEAETAQKILKKGNFLIISTDSYKIKFIDVSNPNSPSIVSTLNLPYEATDMDLKTDFLFVFGENENIKIFNLSDLNNITEIDTTIDSKIQTAKIYRDKLFGVDQVLEIFNVAIPESSTIITNYDMAGLSVSGIGVSQGYVYLLCPTAGIKILEEKSGFGLELIGECPYPNGFLSEQLNKSKIEFIGDFAFFNNGTEGIFILDISDNSQPKILEKIGTRGYANTFAVEGNYLYYTDSAKELYIIDISDYTETFYEDAEDESILRWDVYDNVSMNSTIENVFDVESQSRVIELEGLGIEDGFRLRIDNMKDWHNTSQFVIEWSMRYSESFSIFVDVETTAGQRYLNYTPGGRDNLGEGNYVHHGLGNGLLDEQWHTIIRNLQADLKEAQPGETVLEINGFLIRGSGRLDNIKLKYLSNNMEKEDPSYENAEDGSTKRWIIYDDPLENANISNTFDEYRQSRVIQLSGDGINTGARLKTDKMEKWHNSSQFFLEWSMKFSESFSIYADIETTAGQKYLNYTSGNEDRLGAGRYVHHGLGTGLLDGQWHTICKPVYNSMEYEI